MKNKSIYAVYRGEEFLCEGTAEECGKILNMPKYNVIRLNAPSYKKRFAKNFPTKALMAIKIDEGEETG